MGLGDLPEIHQVTKAQLQHAHRAFKVAPRCCGMWRQHFRCRTTCCKASRYAENAGCTHAVFGWLLSVAYRHSYPDRPAHRTARGPEARSHRCQMQCLTATQALGSSCCMFLARMPYNKNAGMFSHRPHMHRLPATPGGQRCNRRCKGTLLAGVRGCSRRQRIRRPGVCFCLRAVTSTSHGELFVITGGLLVQ